MCPSRDRLATCVEKKTDSNDRMESGGNSRVSSKLEGLYCFAAHLIITYLFQASINLGDFFFQLDFFLNSLNFLRLKNEILCDSLDVTKPLKIRIKRLRYLVKHVSTGSEIMFEDCLWGSCFS